MSKSSMKCSLLFVFLCSNFVYGTSFYLIPNLPGTRGGNPAAVSADGSVVVGSCGPMSSGDYWQRAFRWSPSTGTQDLGTTPNGGTSSYATDISDNGTIIVGGCGMPGDHTAFRWTQDTGMQLLSGIPEGVGLGPAEAISGDGTTIVGHSGWGCDWPKIDKTLYWTESTGVIRLDNDDDRIGIGYGVSYDGSVVVGVRCDAGGAVYCREGNTHSLGTGNYGDIASDVSADGSVIIGKSGGHAFRWTESMGCESLGAFSDGNGNSWASAVSGDGSIVVGGSDRGPSGSHAFIWDQLRGMRDLNEVLTQDYGINLDGMRLGSANAISADGRVIVGSLAWEHNGSSAWVAVLPEPTMLVLLAMGGLGLPRFC